MKLRRAGWEYTKEGATGEMTGFTHTSLYDAVGMEEYQAASEAMVKPPFRYKEWCAVFHPAWNQIVGYVRLNPKDWYRLTDGTVEGPFDMKRRAWPGKTKKVAPGIYEADGVTIFTRDQTEAVGLTEEELP